MERITYTLGDNFRKHGHEVFFLARIYRSKLSDEENEIKQYFFPSENIYSKENIEFYHKFIKQHRIDAVINQNGAEKSSYLYCNIPQGVMLITANHTYPSIDTHCKKQALRNILYNYKLKNLLKYWVKGLLYLPQLMFGNYFTKRRLYKLYSFIALKSDKIVLLSNGYYSDYKALCTPVLNLDNKLFAIPNSNRMCVQQTFDRLNKKKQIIFVGRLSIKEKRPDRLLYIWEMLYKKFPEWEMLVIGSSQNGIVEDYMHRYIKRRGIERLTLLGHCDPDPYYKSASILTLVSSYEGFGLVLTEGMQNGIVPVAFDSYAAARDIIDDGESGYLVTPFDCNEYASKLDLLMSNEELRCKMALKSIQNVHKFDFDNICSLWEMLLQ